MTYLQKKSKFFANLLVAIAGMLSICAAYCTVSGLYSLFGKATMVAIIVAFIEMARVSAVYTLHEFWADVKSKLKWIGIIFVTIGTIISSAGIMGFFANSYGEMTLETAQLDMKSEGKSSEITLARDNIKFEQENLARLDKQIAAERETYSKLKSNEDGSLTQQQKNAQYRINNLQKEINTANKNIRAEQAKISTSTKDITDIKQESFTKSPELAAFGIVGKAIGIKDTGVIVWTLIIMVTCIFDLFAIFLWIWSSNIRRLGVSEQSPAPIKEVKSLKPAETKEKFTVKKLFTKKPKKIIEKSKNSTILEVEPEKKEVKKEVKSKVYKKQPPKVVKKPILPPTTPKMSSNKQILPDQSIPNKDTFSEFVN